MRKKISQPSHNNPIDLQNSSNFQAFSDSPIDINSQINPNSQNFPQYPSMNLRDGNDTEFHLFGGSTQQQFGFSNLPYQFPSPEHQQPTFFQTPDNPSMYSTPQTFNPSFATQDEGIEHEDHEQVPTEVVNAKRKPGKAQRAEYTKEEDKVILQAYLEVSTNKSVNNNQKGALFWKKIYDIYEETRVFREGNQSYSDAERLQWRDNYEKLRGRFRRMSANVSRWAGIMNQLAARPQSGSNTEDVISIAHKIYMEEHPNKHAFVDMHAWDILKDHPQWIYDPEQRKAKKKVPTSGSSVAKRSRLDEAGNYSSSTNPDTPTSGPSSNFSSKGKGKAAQESLETYVAALEKCTLSRVEETAMEREKTAMEREKIQLEKEREARKERKQNIKLYLHLQAKPLRTQ